MNVRKELCFMPRRCLNAETRAVTKKGAKPQGPFWLQLSHSNFGIPFSRKPSIIGGAPPIKYNIESYTKPK